MGNLQNTLQVRSSSIFICQDFINRVLQMNYPKEDGCFDNIKEHSLIQIKRIIICVAILLNSLLKNKDSKMNLRIQLLISK